MDKPFYLPYIKKEQLTADCYTFYFRRTGEEEAFTPGQYYEMKLAHANMDERGDARVFTISSSPTDLDFITITTRIIQSSFKSKLNSLKSGELVQFDGPWNDLNFDESDSSPHVFIAAGIGITPYHSIVKYVIDKSITTKMTLFISWKNRDEMIFDEFFRNAEKRNKSFVYVPTLTDDRAYLEKWRGERGRIDIGILKKYTSEIGDSKFYISGPQAMVRGLRQAVLGIGVLRDKIISEDFEGY